MPVVTGAGSVSVGSLGSFLVFAEGDMSSARGILMLPKYAA
jgi:hypothetical protein